MTTRHARIDEFIEHLGLATESEGLPRIAGRIMAYLLIAETPATFDELMQRLQISRGSVSVNARLLETLGIVQRVTKAGDRKDYYTIAPDPYGRLVHGQLERMRKTRQNVAEFRKALPKELKRGAVRLADMEHFYDYAIENTERFLQGWQQARTK